MHPMNNNVSHVLDAHSCLRLHYAINTMKPFMMDDMFLYRASTFFEFSINCTNTPMTIHIMMDDVYVYHAHNLFLSSCCVGTHVSTSTSETHELEIRAL